MAAVADPAGHRVRQMGTAAGTGADVPVRLAATVLAVAPTEAGAGSDGFDWKLFMVQRSKKASFMPGAYVFPGGVVEPSDSDPHWRTGATAGDAAVEASDDETDASLTLKVAAARELFEEAGVLFATPRDRAAAIAPAELAQWRDQVNADADWYARCVRVSVCLSVCLSLLFRLVLV